MPLHENVLQFNKASTPGHLLSNIGRIFFLSQRTSRDLPKKWQSNICRKKGKKHLKGQGPNHDLPTKLLNIYIEEKIFGFLTPRMKIYYSLTKLPPRDICRTILVEKKILSQRTSRDLPKKWLDVYIEKKFFFSNPAPE